MQQMPWAAAYGRRRETMVHRMLGGLGGWVTGRCVAAALSRSCCRGSRSCRTARKARAMSDSSGGRCLQQATGNCSWSQPAGWQRSIIALWSVWLAGCMRGPGAGVCGRSSRLLRRFSHRKSPSLAHVDAGAALARRHTPPRAALEQPAAALGQPAKATLGLLRHRQNSG